MDLSPLGSLPPELRNEIYKLVLTQNHDIQIIDRRGKAICANTFNGQRRHHILAITKTCKVLRLESLPIFYGINSFFVNTKPDSTCGGRSLVRMCLRDSDPLMVFSQWLRTIGRRGRSSIKRLTFDLGFWSTLPIALDIQQKWWAAARRATMLLRDAGLSSACDARVYLTVEHYREGEVFHCIEHGRPETLDQSFDLVLPTRGKWAALLEAFDAFCVQRNKILEHIYHQKCELRHSEVTLRAITDLLCRYYMVSRALGIDTEAIVVGVEHMWFCKSVWAEKTVW